MIICGYSYLWFFVDVSLAPICVQERPLPRESSKHADRKAGVCYPSSMPSAQAPQRELHLSKQGPFFHTS